MVQVSVAHSNKILRKRAEGVVEPVVLNEIVKQPVVRLGTGLGEFDRVLGSAYGKIVWAWHPKSP